MKIQQKERLALIQYPWIAVSIIGVAGIIGLIVFKLFIPSPTLAADVEINTFTAAYSHDWYDDRNWSIGQIPTKYHRVNIPKEIKKDISFSRNEPIEINGLEILGGISCTFEHALNISGDMIVSAAKAKLEIEDELTIGGNLLVFQQSELTLSAGCQVEIKKDLSIEKSEVHLKGGSLLIQGNLELKRESSYFKQIKGVLQVEGVTQLLGSYNQPNVLKLEGGKSMFYGAIVFAKEASSYDHNAWLKIDGGQVQISSVIRHVPDVEMEPMDIKIELKKGKLHFLEPLLFDSLTADRLVPNLDRNVQFWQSSKEYKRKTEEHIIKVQHEGEVYKLTSNRGLSKDDEPGNSTYWINLGKAKDLDKTCDCTQVSAWETDVTYNRQSSNDEVFVKKEDQIFRLKNSCTFSKNHDPLTEKWAWATWFQCPQRSLFYTDELRLEGGEVRFDKGWKRGQEPVEIASKLVVGDDNLWFYLQDGDEVADMLIKNNSRVQLYGKIKISGDLINFSERPFGGVYDLVFEGNKLQKVGGNQPMEFSNITFNKSRSGLMLSVPLTIGGNLAWEKPSFIHDDGRDKSQAITVFFHEEASTTGLGWISCPVSKAGNTAFIFPVGNQEPAYFAMDSLDKSAMVTVQYFVGQTPNSTNDNQVEKNQYWEVKSSLSINNPRLFWNNNSRATDESINELKVMAWGEDELWKELKSSGNGTFQSLPYIQAESHQRYQIYTFGLDSSEKEEGTMSDFFELKTKDGKRTLVWNYLPQGTTEIGISGQDKESRVSLSKASATREINLTNSENQSLTISTYNSNGLQLSQQKFSNILQSDLIASIFPNPFADYLNVSFRSPLKSSALLELRSSNGQVVATKEVSAADREVKFSSLSGLARGVYLLTISQNGIVQPHQIIKN